ncbi:kinase-like domain-containing protein [Xylariales sp. AK1849]|nr:kinase-like domain-containing protein [Xylariales sp. AK1849]
MEHIQESRLDADRITGTATRPAMKYRRVSMADDEDVEFLEYYEPGGFHPVDLYDILDDRFEVISKLGHGGIATVWLCYEFRKKIWRAVKINAACKSSEGCADLKILKFMQDHSITTTELEAHHLSLPTETFWVDGPNGKHLCSVLPVHGPTLPEWRQQVGTLKDSKRIKDVCFQITEGLGFLHGNGLCHGDFRPQNILMKLKGDAINHIGRDAMCELLGRPWVEEVLTVDGERSPRAPKYIVASLSSEKWKDMVSNDIAIVDFGEAYEASSPPKSLGIPRQYAGPEVVFGDVPGIGSDLWSLAVTLMEVRLNARYVDGYQTIIWRMERFAGPVPPRYRPTAQRMVEDEMDSDDDPDSASDSNPDIQTVSSEQNPSCHAVTASADFRILYKMERHGAAGTNFTKPLEMALATRYLSREGGTPDQILTWSRLDRNEITLLADMLGKVFRYDSEDRLSTSEALQHDWFEGRALSQSSKGVQSKAEVSEARDQLMAFVGPLILVSVLAAGLFSWYYLRILSESPRQIVHAVMVIHVAPK